MLRHIPGIFPAQKLRKSNQLKEIMAKPNQKKRLVLLTKMGVVYIVTHLKEIGTNESKSEAP